MPDVCPACGGRGFVPLPRGMSQGFYRFMAAGCKRDSDGTLLMNCTCRGAGRVEGKMRATDETGGVALIVRLLRETCTDEDGDPYDVALDAANTIESQAAAIASLRSAIETHRSQKADDRCIEDDDRLYEALGDGIKCDRRVGSKIAMAANCIRFINQRCESGHWPSYVELEAALAAKDAEIERLRAELDGLQQRFAPETPQGTFYPGTPGTTGGRP